MSRQRVERVTTVIFKMVVQGKDKICMLECYKYLWIDKTKRTIFNSLLFSNNISLTRTTDHDHVYHIFKLPCFAEYVVFVELENTLSDSHWEMINKNPSSCWLTFIRLLFLKAELLKVTVIFMPGLTYKRN